jgi:hypothetical protein
LKELNRQYERDRAFFNRVFEISIVGRKRPRQCVASTIRRDPRTWDLTNVTFNRYKPGRRIRVSEHVTHCSRVII